MFSLLERIIAGSELESGLSCGYFLDVEAGRGRLKKVLQRNNKNVWAAAWPGLVWPGKNIIAG